MRSVPASASCGSGSAKLAVATRIKIQIFNINIEMVLSCEFVFVKFLNLKILQIYFIRFLVQLQGPCYNISYLSS
jgi:hypothetical protein